MQQRKKRMGGAEELVTIVDETNNKIGAVDRRVMRADRLTHRATYILVFNSEGEIYVQKRTPIKDVFPGFYDVAAGGVVLAGETYEQGAERELAEELGIRGAPLEPLFDFYYADEHVRLWGRAFSCVYDGEMVLQEEEVESGSFMKVEAVFRLAESEPFTPDCLYALQRYIGSRVM
jgi:8-oxo-dGTP pyrophosphatase MutT (NUDIX family)